MFFGNSTHDTRPFFFMSWQKYKQNQLLTPLETQLVKVMLEHPEYHSLFDLQMNKAVVEQQPLPLPTVGGQVSMQEIEQENPFLHLGLHLAIRDQVDLDRPNGIAAIYQSLLSKYTDAHHVEHVLMEPLAKCLWEANRLQQMPDDVAYLLACKELIQYV